MEKYSIKDLLKGEVVLDQGEISISHDLSGIEIPIIQRDYAQGRSSEKTVRNRFLKAIFSKLIKGDEMELDFVYGSIKSIKKNDKEVNIFLPLDGQQRLTTIFLLRWFIANSELDGEDLDRERLILSNFTYSTRSTARMFCEKLAQIGYTNEPVQKIKSAYWYHKSFSMDPTVKGMLNTLEDIQSHYKTHNQPLYGNLDKLQFYILPLDGFDLSDELYIKMNARGKPLTDFENFKADWINWMKSDENLENAHYKEEVLLGDNLVPKYLSIASLLDNQWTDIFWPVAITNEKEEDKIVDEYFLRFIGRFCLSQFITSSQLKAQDIEKRTEFKLFYSSNDKLSYNSFEVYADILTFENVSRLEKILNAIHKYQSEIREIIKPQWDTNNNWFLYDSGITQIQRILFLAVTEYLSRNEFDAFKFRNWMRIVWNLISDPDIRSIGVMIGTMKTIHLLAEGSGDINNYILNDGHAKFSSQTSDIQKSQLREEKLKLSLFGTDDWEEQILYSETHPLFQGNIGFIIDDNPSKSEFKHRLRNAFLLFGSQGPRAEYDIDYRVLRSCISRFTTWEEISEFGYSNDSRYWQLLLRRNDSIKESILHLCSLDEDEIHHEMKHFIESESSASGMDDLVKLHQIHTNLYFYTDFFKWIQKTGSKGTMELKELNGYWYLIRKGAWYDKVIIEGFRNEIIDKFSQLANLSANKYRCDSSHFYWGENIVYTISLSGSDWKVVFNRHNHVEVRKRVEEDNENVWKQTYLDTEIINSVEDIDEAGKAADNIWSKLNES